MVSIETLSLHTSPTPRPTSIPTREGGGSTKSEGAQPQEKPSSGGVKSEVLPVQISCVVSIETLSLHTSPTPRPTSIPTREGGGSTKSEGAQPQEKPSSGDVKSEVLPVQISCVVNIE